MDHAVANESRAVVPVAVVIATVGASAIVVALRSYTRIVIIKQFGYDDIGAVVALLMAIGCGASIASGTLYGLGRHISTLDRSLIQLYLRSFYVAIVMYNAALTSVKFTFLLQYYRIFGLTKIRRAITIAGVFIGSWTLSQLLIVIFTCHPIDKFWDRSRPGTCIPSLPFWYINAAGNILTDVTIFVLPLPVLRTLNLRRNQKIVLLGIFSLGFFVSVTHQRTCAISLIRIQYLRISTDITWDNIDASCWSIAEPCCAIICACLPVLRPLASKLLCGVAWSSRGTNAKTYQQHSAGRDGAYPPSRHHSNRGVVTDYGTPSQGSSQRIFVVVSGASDALHTRGLELQHLDSDGGCSSDVTKTSPPGAALVGRSADGRSRILGSRPSVTTEIKATTSRTPDASTPARGITMYRNIVIEDENGAYMC